MVDKLIEIQMSRTRLFLLESELMALLSRDMTLWETAVKRGKGIMRSEQARERNQKGSPSLPARGKAANVGNGIEKHG